jgi:beta-lactamase regulating signal transducer with metallopeptidase domain
MTDHIPEISWQVFRSTIFLSVAALVALMALRKLNTRSLRTNTMAWSIVLAVGVMLNPATLNIPWYPSLENRNELVVPPEIALHRTVQSPASDVTRAADPAASASVIADVQPETGHSWWTRISRSLPVLWLAGIAVIFSMALAGYAGLLMALRSTWKPQRSWRREYSKAAMELGLSSTPPMVAHASLGPFLCLTPRGHRLVVPSDQWVRLSAAERHVVLKHELAHFSRGDVWRSIPVRLVVLLHWFNPLAWLAAGRIEETAEWASDRLALQNDSQRAGDLANALLKLSQTSSRSMLFAPAARGRSLAKRLKHLIAETQQTGADPMLRKLLTLTMLACVLIAGAVQIRLVAQESEIEEQEPGRTRVTAARAKEFADRLANVDDLTEELKDVLSSESGALVLRDRAGHYEAMAREEMRADAIPQLFSDWFEPVAAGLQLRSGQDQFRADFLKNAEIVNNDIAMMKQALRDVSTRMDLNSDIDKLVHRFITDDGAPVILYARELRPRLRPGVQILERVFEEIFALRRDGRYEIRADARPRAEEMATAFDERLKILDRMKRDVAEFADDIAGVDEFHKHVIVALKDPLLVTRLGIELFEGPAANRGHAERLLGHLEGGFREGAEGLIVREQEQEGVDEFVAMRDRLNAVAGSLRGPLHEFADKVADDDQLHQTWRQILKTDVAVVRVAERVEYATADVGDAVREFLSQILVENDNGRLYVQPPELPEEELVEAITDMFRQHRAARRKGREVDTITAQIMDRELQAAMQSVGGKLTFGDYLQQRLMADVPDGLAQWAADHFDETADGLVIREEQREEIAELVRQAEEVARELQNADF